MRMSRAYDFQSALCEDPDAIKAWFRLVENMKAKYGIVDCNFYNFDETGFMIGMIASSMIVARAERKGRGKIFNLVIGNGPQLYSASMGKVGACSHMNCSKVTITSPAGTPKPISRATGRLELQRMDGRIIKPA